jgi:hypothetical protein
VDGLRVVLGTEAAAPWWIKAGVVLLFAAWVVRAMMRRG